jgi:dTDP-4-amino-4,6-dideoxygalactose transaminase
MLEKRRKNAEAIRSTAMELEALKVQKIPSGTTHGHYVCAPVIEDTTFSVEKTIKKLNSMNIASRKIYSVPCHQQRTYLEGIKHWRWSKYITYPDYSQVSLPITERTARSHFEVPIHPGVTPDEIGLIQDALQQIFS